MRIFSLDQSGVDVVIDTSPVARVFNLGSTDEADIRVFLPGPAGPPISDWGSFLLPVDVSSGVIPVPTFRNQRTFISALSAPVVQPTLANPPDNGSWFILLQSVGANSITLNNATNIKLSKQCVFSADTILALLWDGNSRYIEVYRNGI